MSLIKFTGYKSNNIQLKQFQDKLVRQTEREYKIILKTKTHKTEEFNKIFQIQFLPKYSLSRQIQFLPKYSLSRQIQVADELFGTSMLLPVGLAYAVYLVPDLILFSIEKAIEYNYYREQERKI